MALTITSSQIFVLDQDQALDFYVGKLGLQVHTDADLGFMRWLSVCTPDDPTRQIVLEKPGPPSMGEETAAQVRELVTKGAIGGWIIFTVDDAYAAWESLQGKGIEFSSEPTEQPYGVDFGLRDPFGNHIRMGHLNESAKVPMGKVTMSVAD